MGRQHGVVTGMDPSDPATFPLLLTVAELAGVLRTSRSSAYAIVREHVASGDPDGLRVIRTRERGSVRVTRTSVLRLLQLVDE
jgi:hypothetical protein